MANRCLLHQKKLSTFRKWLVAEGWELHPVKGDFEVLRAKKGKQWVVVYFRIGTDVHYTVMDKDVALVRRFLKSIKNGGPYQCLR
jgi:hypothetical protein